MPQSTRQLAAIMFTDIVGYTALMGKDSNKAMELVRQSVQIQKPLVEKHNGKWLKEMGDGAMAQFGSALDAVNCALEIQQTSRADFDADFRIGIHLGDITIENNDVYGDGVNVAARLESIADPGGIYISESIEKAIRGQGNIQAKYLGESQLKNVDYGVRTYALQGVGLPVPDLKKDKEISGRFFAEIKRRGIVRAGVMYILISTILILLLPFVQSWMSIPDLSSNKLLIILGVGFILAMYLAWRFEKSPAGFVRSSSEQSWQNPLKVSQRKPLTGNIVMGGLVIIILYLFAYPENKSISHQAESPAEESVIDQSIAVLPFIDMSRGKDQEYFSDGMMEEILNHLYKIGDLKVTSRTSAMRYKNSTKSIREIGKELGVAHILEGSVRKDENNVRITVQLIDVNTDAHMWADNYDRELRNVFAIQSEVAQQIAKFLKAEISPEVEKILEAPASNNTEAYNLYLKARSLPFSKNDESINLLHEAIKLDPNFSNAYVMLALRLQNGAIFKASEGGMDPNRAWVISKPYIQKALEVDPNNGAAHERMAWSLLWFEWDFKGAEKEYLESKRIYPNYTWTDYLVATGNFDQAVKEAGLVIEFDPTSSTLWSGKILSQFFAGQHEEVLTTINSALKDSTNVFREFKMLESLRVWMYLGMYEEVIESAELLVDQNPDIESPPRLMAIASISYLHTGQTNKSIEYLNSLIAKSKINAGGSPSFYIAMVYSQKGEIDEAFKWLEKSYRDREVEMYWLKVEPPFEPIRSDPRYQEMLDKVGFPE